MTATLVEAALQRLPRVFHSEADLQQALAWALHRHFPSLTVRAEYPVRGGTVDLWLIDENSTIAVELKYPKTNFEAQPTDETFRFGNDPTDMGCYEYLVDIEQLETLVRDGLCDRGVAVMLTNDSLFWDNRPRGANYDEFKLYDGRTVSGTLAWPKDASLRESQDRVLELNGEYTFTWRDYDYQYPEQANGNTVFKYCLSEVQ